MIGFPLGKGQPKETGAKAFHLDLATQKGLAVPSGLGFALNDLSEEVLARVAHDVSHHLGQGPYAVRSSFRGEDSATQSQAGRYDSVLFVEFGQLSALIIMVSLMNAWRNSRKFSSQTIAANSALMSLGFLFIFYQLTGYIVEG